MTSKSPIRHSKIRHEEFISPHSLAGMERVVLQNSPNRFIFQNINPFDIPENKPLPPTPRRPSSVYSGLVEDIIEGYEYRSPSDKESLSQTFYPSATVPGFPPASDIKSLRPALERLRQGHSQPDFALNRAPSRPPIDCMPGTRSETSIQRLRNQGPDLSSPDSLRRPKQSRSEAERHAAEYKATISELAESPAPIEAMPYYDYSEPPGLPSARIVDVVDHSLMPQPLQMIKSDDVRRPNSAFSSSDMDSDDDLMHHGVRESLRAYARKAFHLPKVSPEERERRRVMSIAEAKHPYMSPPSSRRPSKFGSISSERRASLQQSLADMYITVKRLSITSPKANSKIEPTGMQRTNASRNLRSPAIPITPYQRLGARALEKSPKSPKGKSPITDYFSFRPSGEYTRSRHSSPNPSKSSQSRPGLGKLASALRIESSYAESSKVSPALRRTKSEQRREELKKKIIVLSPPTEYPNTQVGRWV